MSVVVFFLVSSWIVSLYGVDGQAVAPVDVVDVQPLLQDGPNELWSIRLPPILAFNDVGVHKSNGVHILPSDGVTAVVTTRGAGIYAIDAYTGVEKWSYRPPPAVTTPTLSVTRCHSGVSFFSSPNGDDEFLVYTVIDDQSNVDDDAISRVVALDVQTGQELWISAHLIGVAQGTPLISSDGRYVFVTHNQARETQGFFTILSTHETPGSSSQQPGKIKYSEFTGVIGEDSIAFGPPGIFHSPIRGNYDPYDGGYKGDPTISQGDDNTNDFIMWGQTPKPSDIRANQINNGYLYGFQFPRDFDSNNVTAAAAAFSNYDVTMFQLGRDIRDFQVTTPPVITNDGVSAYWGVSRSGFRGWTSSNRFSRLRNAVEGFIRNADFAGQPIFATPALSNGVASSSSEPFVFCGTSSTEFVKLNHDFTESVSVATSSLIKSRAIVDVHDRVVYYVEQNGNLHQADLGSLTDMWSYTTITPASAVDGQDTVDNISVEGEMALTPNGDVLIVADTSGNVMALQVSEIPPTSATSGGDNSTAISREQGTRSLRRA
jgi:outer membrane protein assembly factor BamB